MNPTIIDQATGQRLNLTMAQIDQLLFDNMIYPCPPEKAYHLAYSRDHQRHYTMSELEDALRELQHH